MKPKIALLSALLLLAVGAQAQIAIGKDNVEGSALIDFETAGNTRGIILPAVTALPATPENGTLIYDTVDRKVKVYADNDWVELSGAGTNAQVDMNQLNAATDEGEGTVIGEESTAPEGVLVLESPDKALVLPKIASPHLNVASPYPGMICYDTDTQAVAVFNGSQWYFWK